MLQPHWSHSSRDFFTRTRDDWLTDVMGVECWNVSSVTQMRTHAATDRIKPFAGPAFLTAKVPVRSIQTAKRLSELGFYLVDTALTFQFIARNSPESQDLSSPCGSIWLVDDATCADAESIGQIASRALTSSRFHLDPEISSETASIVKYEWARGLACGRRGVRCRVIRDVDGVKGFLGVVESLGNEKIFSIDLIAVDIESQSHGLGATLVRDFIHIAHTEGALAQVATQAANTAAVRFYERLGFTLTSAMYVMHAHVLTEEPS